MLDVLIFLETLKLISKSPPNIGAVDIGVVDIGVDVGVGVGVVLGVGVGAGVGAGVGIGVPSLKISSTKIGVDSVALS